LCRLLAVIAEDMMPEQRRVQAGSTVTLPCYVTATHSDDVTDRKLRHSRRASRLRSEQSSDELLYDWRRDDEPIDASVSSKFSVDALDHSLTIRNASSVSDTAVYSCVRRRRSHGNPSHTDDVTTSPQIQLVVEGSMLLSILFLPVYKKLIFCKSTLKQSIL